MVNNIYSVSIILTSSILLGILLSIVILFMENKKSLFSIDGILYVLWIAATVIFISILIIIMFTGEYEKFLPPLGILLASLIASASVMKSIYATKELKKQDILSENKKLLMFMFHILLKIELELKSIRHSKNDKKQVLNNFERIYTLIEKIQDYKFFSFVANEQYFEFFNLESLIKNLESALLKDITDDKNIESKVFQVEMEIVSIRDMITKQLNDL